MSGFNFSEYDFASDVTTNLPSAGMDLTLSARASRLLIASNRVGEFASAVAASSKLSRTVAKLFTDSLTRDLMEVIALGAPSFLATSSAGSNTEVTAPVVPKIILGRAFVAGCMN